MAEKTVTNFVIRALIDAAEEVLGQNGLKSLLNYGNMKHLLENKPDYNFEKNFTNDDFNAISSNFYNVIGASGARAIFRLMGHETAKRYIAMGAFNSFLDLSPEEKLKKTIELYASASGRGTFSDNDGVIAYDNPQCTICSRISDGRPSCTIVNGVLDELIKWAGAKGKRTVETKCKSNGDDTCRHEIHTG